MLKVFEAAFEAYTQDRVHEFSMEQKEYYTRYLEFFGRLLKLRPASLTSFRQPITPTNDRVVQCWLHNVLNMVDTRVKWETFVQFPHSGSSELVLAAGKRANGRRKEMANTDRATKDLNGELWAMDAPPLADLETIAGRRSGRRVPRAKAMRC